MASLPQAMFGLGLFVLSHTLDGLFALSFTLVFFFVLGCARQVFCSSHPLWLHRSLLYAFMGALERRNNLSSSYEIQLLALVCQPSVMG
jgi:hypothetical protein